ncbi:hypothetical protein BVRB_8g184860 [Beta vulgaris subsp. vulgaris]|uniref:Cystatin domain-containing protein n=1 Tax=Beta vulgaris subsp. vulgaris TaxID=3555 RepID=A0A0J8EMH9_BETVV|nr:hypothetical protein BVRB_8g184860 [Beta vulgaris subsp. vulgaris]
MSTRHILLIFSLLAVISAASAATRRGPVLGGYRPIKDIKDPYVQEIAKFAVDEHNKEEGSHLKLVKIVKGESQVVSGTNYRLTLSADDSQKYVAVVYDKPWQHQRSLTSFEKSE